MAYLSPVPKLQFIDANGNPVVGGKLYTYAAGTTTPLATYTSASGLTPNSNPVILDSAGMASVWLGSNVYKMKLTTATDVELWTVDDISGSVTLEALAASGGSALIGFIQAGAGAVARTVQSKLRDLVNVMDFIPAGTDTATTDCQPFIKAAITEVSARGGGTLYFPAGTYNLATVESDGSVSAHFTLLDKEGIHFLGYGAVLSSSYSSTSYSALLFNLNGCRRMSFEGFDVVGTFARTLNVVSQYSIGVFHLRSVNRDSESISMRNMRAQNVHWFLTSQADPNDVNRVRTVLVENVFCFNGYYGLNFANNCDNFTAINFRTNRFVRTYFPYGVSNHNVNYTSIGGDVFTDCLIKAYSRDTVDITVNALIIGNTSNDSRVTIESQHPPATQPTPAVLKNIVLNVNDLESSGSGPSLRFAYWQDTPSPTPTPTSSTTLFDNITVRGNVRSFLQFAVAQPTASGAINFQGLVYNPVGSGNPYDYGFYEPVSRYTQGNNTYAFQVLGNKPLGVFGGAVFGLYDGTLVGYFDGTGGGTSFKFRAQFNYPYSFTYADGYTAGTLVYEIPGNTSGSFGVRVYEGADSATPNADNAVMKIGQMDVSGRSLNTAGTLNASGADYAEYELNNGLSIPKGCVVGFKADGTLTLTFSEAVRFGVKSTAPSFVGGDTWATDAIVGTAPERPVRKSPVLEKGFDEDGRHIDILVEPGDSDDEWQTKMDAYSAVKAEHDAKIEAERVKVDRVAYSGKVPVNVTGATPGDYIIAAHSNDRITGVVVKNPTFDQYRLAVGRVNRILDDGRAEIAVIVH